MLDSLCQMDRQFDKEQNTLPTNFSSYFSVETIAKNQDIEKNSFYTPIWHDNVANAFQRIYVLWYLFYCMRHYSYLLLLCHGNKRSAKVTQFKYKFSFHA